MRKFWVLFVLAGTAGGILGHLSTPYFRPATKAHLPHNRDTEFIDDRGTVIVSEPTLTFEVTIRNPTGQAATFGPLTCHCACSECVLPKNTLEPGEAMTVLLKVNAQYRTGNESFACDWADDTKRKWTAGVRTHLVRPESFDVNHIILKDAVAGQVIERGVVYRQYAANERDLPPAPDYISGGGHVVVTCGDVRVSHLSRTVVLRETHLSLKLTVPDNVGGVTRIHPTVKVDPMNSATTLTVQWNPPSRPAK